MGPLPAGAGARLNPEVIVAALAISEDSTALEDGMSDKQHGSPVFGWRSPAEGGSDASVL